MEWEELQLRQGSFLLPKRLIEKYTTIVRKFLSNILVYKAEFIDFGQYIKYYGFSEVFFEIANPARMIEDYYVKEQYVIVKKNCIMFGKTYEKGDSVLIKLELKRFKDKNTRKYVICQ